MSEDEPMEREVAIDPEMLGKVFENLLDEDHRRAKGAFYTPREVVHYMCQQCLINYLSENSDISVSAIKDFILYGDFYKDVDTEKTLKVTDANGRYHYEIDPNRAMKISPEIFSLKNGVNKLKVVDDLLSNIRVADPAVGSGAFPLGMLNEIVRARQNLTAYMAIGMNAFDTRLMYSIERSPYALKYTTIKDCIFAADIEPSAVDIARLRLWLSLVIDDEINPNAQNTFEGHQNPSPLPNLECNIVCGNSLVDEFEGTQLINNSLVIGTKGQLDLNSARFESMLPKLLDAQDRLFKCDDPVKKEDIKDEISNIQNMIIHTQISLMSDEIRQKYYECARHASKPYVLWQIEFAKVFNEKGGFDVVIGNPPYLKEIDYKEVFDTVNKTNFGKKYGEGKMNFWYYFFHKGLDLLKPETGILSFIAPNYFVAGSGAKKLNDRLVNQCTIKTYVDFNKTKVFESADVQCMILVVEDKKPSPNDSFKAYMFKQKVDHSDLPEAIQNLDESSDIACYVVNNQSEIISSDYKINFENAKYSEVLKKIERSASGRKLFKATQGVVENPSFLNNKNIKALREKGYDVSLYNPGQGVFVIPKEELTELGLNNEEKELLREYHEPNEVHRYVCDKSFKNYLLYITRETVEDIDKYPNIKRHLLQYKPFMEQRRETQKGTVKWFQLHWPRKENLFTGEKIVYPQMGAVPTFAYSNKPYFVNMSTNIVCAQENINMQVLTCILNSSLAHFWLLHRAKNRGVGLDIAVAVIDKFPVNRTILSDAELSKLAKEVISLAEDGNDYSDLDNLIDDRVFELYGISQEERSMIENYIEERVNHG